MGVLHKIGAGGEQGLRDSHQPREGRILPRDGLFEGRDGKVAFGEFDEHHVQIVEHHLAQRRHIQTDAHQTARLHGGDQIADLTAQKAIKFGIAAAKRGIGGRNRKRHRLTPHPFRQVNERMVEIDGAKCVKPVLNAARGCGHQRLARLQHLFHLARDDGDQKIAFRLKVIVGRAFGHFGAGGDIFDAGGIKALFAEQVCRRLNDAAAAVCLLTRAKSCHGVCFQSDENLMLTLILSELQFQSKRPQRPQQWRDVMKAKTTLAASIVALAAAHPAFAEEINALVWCDHADAALIEPFEAATGHSVNLKEYEGTAAGLAILDQSQPGDWDVLVIDAVDVGRAVDAGLMAELPAEALPTADFWPEVVMADNNTRDGKTYAVTEKFGYNTIAYDKTKVDPADMDDMAALTSGKYDGRIAIYDYYLPVLGLVAMGAGVPTAGITAENLGTLEAPLMALRAASRQVSDVVSAQTALATGEVDIVVGGGEWLTAVLAGENANLDWTIPKQGAVRWAQSIGVLEASTKKDAALEFVQYIVSPEGQARLATSACYWGMPANAKAGDALTADQKAVLRWDSQAEYLARAQLYPIPDAALDTAMQDLWTKMLQQ